MNNKVKRFSFRGVTVMDAAHYKMLKELYSDELQGKVADKSFQERRKIYASIIAPLDENEKCLVGDDVLLAAARELGVERLLPCPPNEMEDYEKQNVLIHLSIEFQRVIADWGAPPIHEHTKQWVDRMFSLLLK